MSAREKLFEAMAGGWSLTHAEGDSLYRIVDDVLGVHAHELAEQQRMWALDYVGDGDDSSYDYTYAVTLGAKLVADLIDPGVSPVRPDEEPTP